MRVITVTSNILIRHKLLLFSAIAVVVCFILTQNIFAQESTSSSDVDKINITFPIAQLGNCTSIENCREYCEKLENKDACIAFAKEKGFYKTKIEAESNSRQVLLLEKAKEELGCSTHEACKTFCSNENNHDKCKAFALKYQLIKEELQDSKAKDILEKAKQILGCDSHESCKAFCQNEENREKCSDFAKAAGLGGGLMKPHEERNETERHLEELERMARKCKEHPEECEASFSGREKFTPESEKAYENASAQAKFCREYPEKCKNASGSANFEEKKKLEEKLKHETEYKREIEKKKMEFEKKGLEINKEKAKLEEEYRKKKLELQQEGSEDVKGVSKTPSFLNWFFNVFLK